MLPTFTHLAALQAEDKFVKSVSFKASRPNGEYGLYKLSDTVFQLGLGPCGLFVDRLKVEICGSLLKITQVAYASPDPDPDNRLWDYHTERAEVHRPRSFGLRGDSYWFEHHQGALKELRKARSDWRVSREIKEFVYKMSDVHSRIVTIK